MAVTIPEFIDKRFLTRCLQGEFGYSTVVTNFKAERLISEDLDFTSCLVRVKCEYKRNQNEDVESTSLIVKAPLQGSYTEMLEKEGCKEQYFYYNIVPKLSTLHSLDFPRTFECGSKSVIVMEDLNSSGFKVPKSMALLDFEHCKLYIQSVAKLQATSIVLNEREPKYFENFKASSNKLTNEDVLLKQRISTMATIGAKSLADLVRGLHKHEEIGLVKILDKVSNIIWDLVMSSEDSNDSLKCLIQYDIWPTNLMFKYDELGNVKSVKILDFQMYSFSPAVIDIIAFIWRSANYDVRESRLEELFHIYVDTLNDILSDLGSSTTLTFSQLKKQLEIFSPWALFVVCFFLPYGQVKQHLPLGTLFEFCDKEPQKYYDILIQAYKKSSPYFETVLLHLEAQGVFESISKLYIK
ncbi:uncharacterized protein LOC124367714 [Homalodisca vitripennis]|uniref:uncharacterized protein LOC124367714 n=1 Tax=Homalodisca vitripennis TaxID=197043 RepID=UPI001EEB0DEE|nr:uncharacterized protein LOC124367714 [Homalodisca vitripennis]